MLKPFFNNLLSLFFPERCSGCGRKNTPLCRTCLSEIEPAENTGDSNLIALFSYKDSGLRRAVWLLKYRNRRTLAEIFAAELADFLTEELSDRKIFNNLNQTLLIPIPLAGRGLRRRGYNQSALIARELARLASLALAEGILVKIKETPAQMSLNRQERLRNLEGAFAVSQAEQIAGCDIILIDDVITTGATMREAAKVLKQAGAKSVLAVAIAH